MIRSARLAVIAAGLAGPLCSSAETAKPNILLIVFDDLNDWVSPLGGHPQARTPNFERLARRGMTFTNAHITAPLCNPSRASLMSGMLSSSLGVYVNRQDWRKAEALSGRPRAPAVSPERWLSHAWCRQAVPRRDSVTAAVLRTAASTGLRRLLSRPRPAVAGRDPASRAPKEQESRVCLGFLRLVPDRRGGLRDGRRPSGGMGRQATAGRVRRPALFGSWNLPTAPALVRTRRLLRLASARARRASSDPCQRSG